MGAPLAAITVALFGNDLGFGFCFRAAVGCQRSANITGRSSSSCLPMPRWADRKCPGKARATGYDRRLIMMGAT